MKVNVNIVSGFLGAGKTTFLKKLIPALNGKVVLIENEFGEVGIDGDLLPSDLQIREINAGCICCSVTHDFQKAIEELAVEFQPEEIMIEPSGVACLSDIIKLCQRITAQGLLDIRIKYLVTIVDARAVDDYLEEFGMFYQDQIENARIILLSFFDELSHEVREKVTDQLRSVNNKALILKEDWLSLDIEELKQMLDSAENWASNFQTKPELLPANKIFTTYAVHDPKVISLAEMEKIMSKLKSPEWGFILRAKGILNLATGETIHFDHTPYNTDWSYLAKRQSGKVALIGVDLNTEAIGALFQNGCV